MRAPLTLSAVALGLMAPLAGADVLWTETGDAGSLVDSAQMVTGSGDILMISGVTDGDPDREDLYVINIVDPGGFSAVTGPGELEDTQLWLFDMDGFLVTANDDDLASPVQYGSGLHGGPNDDGTPGLVTPGLYVLAVTGFGSPANGPGDPVDAGGALLATHAFDEHSGPDGPGGGNPLAGWQPGGYVGAYNILIEGAVALPAPGALALLGLAGVVSRRRRRRTA